MSCSDENDYVWQIHAGKPGKKFWKTVHEDLADILVKASRQSSATCQCEYDGRNVYTYSMLTNVQTSQRTGTWRNIRRIPSSPVKPK